MLPRLVKFFLSGLESFESIIPASFKSAGHQAVGWINFFVTPLSQLGLVLQALDPHAPLLIDGLAATLQFLHRPKSNLDLFWAEDFQNAITDGFVDQVSLDPHALRGIVGVCLATGAFVNGINPSMTGVARRQSASAMPTEKQPLQESAALACSATGTLLRLIGLVLLEHLLVFQVIVPPDVTGMMVLNQDQPGVYRLPLHSGMDLSLS